MKHLMHDLNTLLSELNHDGLALLATVVLGSSALFFIWVFFWAINLAGSVSL